MDEAPHDVLFLPGPVEVDPELRAILAQPMIGHRSQRFKDETSAICRKLGPLFRTGAHTLWENVPATGLMEASIRNLVERRVLHLTCGAFSERWATISESCGREAVALPAAGWGARNEPEALRDALRTKGPFEAITITHNETSTGVLNPLRELCAVVREVAPETLVLVDAVSSLAGAELEFDAWGVDCAFAGTQKALALPPGLCVFAVSARALKKAERTAGRGFLLDFVRQRDGLQKGETVATPCVPLALALSAQLDRIAKEGLEARWRRHLSLRDEVVRWAQQNEIAFFAQSAASRSPTVSCLAASGRDVPELVRRARAERFVVDGGYGKLKGQTFRIGHMGDHPLERLRALLAAIP
jgi:aspartate aminotransferase-like enzyme